jgi:hypothetical protein
MERSRHGLRLGFVVLAGLLPALGCASLRRSFSSFADPSPAPALGFADEPPPLHTGGLGALVVGPGGQGAPSLSPAHYGNPSAAGLATGIGVAVLGTGAAGMVAECARPGASPTCLRGLGPMFDSDAGATFVGDGAAALQRVPADGGVR